MSIETEGITLKAYESPVLIQAWLYKSGNGSLRILTSERDEHLSIDVSLEEFLNFIREQTIKRS